MTCDMPVRQALHFLGQAAVHFRQTGAIAPSSRRLAHALAEAAGHVAPGEVIIELGPGSGIVTETLRRLHPQAVVLAVENNASFATRLSGRMPGVRVVHGCASRLPGHLQDLGLPEGGVAAVVSGLPLLSLPPDLVERIFAAVREVLAPGRRFVQFTYSARAFRRLAPLGFRAEPQRRVWLNVPPAVVLPFARMPDLA
jgi:phosphatidylethanolamine/phosphatidyl-N-methylethanolamine N-methyltransferase